MYNMATIIGTAIKLDARCNQRRFLDIVTEESSAIAALGTGKRSEDVVCSELGLTKKRKRERKNSGIKRRVWVEAQVLGLYGIHLKRREV